MRKGKILQVSVFLSCCCLNSFAYNISMSDNIGKQTASIVKAAALKDLGTQQSSDNVKLPVPSLTILVNQSLVQQYE